jgi:hypothetical protein
MNLYIKINTMCEYLRPGDIRLTCKDEIKCEYQKILFKDV